ncbi:MAG: response regulator transcription factor [Clostridiales bacterium]|nr:response regulator transcription factor [Clostridiales bacterium]
MSEKILIVEDEEKIARFIELELTHEGYEISKALNGREGLEMAENGHFDLLLLDIMLPELSGLEVLRRIRKHSSIPIIMLTARDAISDKVSGLDMGADDYITKPFAIEELLARIRVALKRKPADSIYQNNVLEAGMLSLDTDSHQVTYDGEPIELTNREFNLLQVLLENKSIVLSRDTLLERVWGYDYMGETNVVDVYVYYLRSKIDDVVGEKIIETVRGVGYVIK